MVESLVGGDDGLGLQRGVSAPLPVLSHQLFPLSTLRSCAPSSPPPPPSSALGVHGIHPVASSRTPIHMAAQHSRAGQL